MNVTQTQPGWATRPLRDVVTKLVDWSHNPPAKRASGLPMLSARNIENGRIVFSEYRFISEGDFLREHERTRVAPGDVLLTIVGSIGRAAVFPDGVAPFAIQRSVAVMTPIDILPKFLMYQFQSPSIQRHFETNARGTAQMGIYLGILADTPIQVAPLAKQERIVAEIEKQFSRLDEAVANLTRVKVNFKRYRAAVLKAAVEGRLVPTEADLAHREGRTYETGQQLLARVPGIRRDYEKGMGKDREPTPRGITDLPRVPEGWVSASTEQVCSSVRDGTHNTPAYVTEGVPLITSKNLTETGIDFENVKLISEADHVEISRRSGVAPGDVLFAMIGTIGNPCVVTASKPFSIKNVGLFKKSPETLLPQFLCQWLASPPFDMWLRPHLKGTTQKFAPLGLLREIPLPVPPISEQRRIVAEVERRLSIADEMKAQAEASLHSVERLRRAILKWAFEGELGLGDTRDEPVSRLLSASETK